MIRDAALRTVLVVTVLAVAVVGYRALYRRMTPPIPAGPPHVYQALDPVPAIVIEPEERAARSAAEAPASGADPAPEPAISALAQAALPLFRTAQGSEWLEVTEDTFAAFALNVCGRAPDIARERFRAEPEMRAAWQAMQDKRAIEWAIRDYRLREQERSAAGETYVPLRAELAPFGGWLNQRVPDLFAWADLVDAFEAEERGMVWLTGNKAPAFGSTAPRDDLLRALSECVAPEAALIESIPLVE